jgi:hypothetical protein
LPCSPPGPQKTRSTSKSVTVPMLIGRCWPTSRTACVAGLERWAPERWWGRGASAFRAGALASDAPRVWCCASSRPELSAPYGPGCGDSAFRRRPARRGPSFLRRAVVDPVERRAPPLTSLAVDPVTPVAPVVPGVTEEPARATVVRISISAWPLGSLVHPATGSRVRRGVGRAAASTSWTPALARVAVPSPDGDHITPRRDD